MFSFLYRPPVLFLLKLLESFLLCFLRFAGLPFPVPCLGVVVPYLCGPPEYLQHKSFHPHFERFFLGCLKLYLGLHCEDVNVSNSSLPTSQFFPPVSTDFSWSHGFSSSRRVSQADCLLFSCAFCKLSIGVFFISITVFLSCWYFGIFQSEGSVPPSSFSFFPFSFFPWSSVSNLTSLVSEDDAVTFSFSWTTSGVGFNHVRVP